MKERPILFSAPMVRAILEGRKTQTRRVVKKLLPLDVMASELQEHYDALRWEEAGNFLTPPCPYGQRGDRLWVRETFEKIPILGDDDEIIHDILYRADMEDGDAALDRWTPSIHMPRWASRITLEITDVRVERLRDISEVDAVAEGCGKSIGGMFCGGPHKAHGAPTQHNTAKEAYAHLWETINGQDSWAENPWVWVVSFKRIET